MESFLTNINDAFSSPTETAQAKLADLLSIDPRDPHIPHIQNEIQGMQNEQLLQKIEFTLKDASWSSFERLNCDYMIYVRDFSPWSAFSSVDLMIQYFDSLTSCFSHPIHGPKCYQLVLRTVMFLCPLVKRVDARSFTPKKDHLNRFPRCKELSRLLLKLFNSIRTDKDLKNEQKRDKQQLLFIVTVNLCYMYFIIDSPLLCGNLFNNMNLIALPISKIQVPLSEQLRYHFIVAKYHFVKQSFMKSFAHFEWCLNHSPRTSVRTIERILDYLVPIGLVIGKVVRLSVVMQLLGKTSSLFKLYSPLILSYKKGDVFGFSVVIYENQEYFRDRGVLLTLLQNTRLMILRNLLYRAYSIVSNSQLTKPNTLSFDAIKTSLHLALQPEQSLETFEQQHMFSFFLKGVDCTISDLFAENLLISLIDSNLVKGNIYPRLRLVGLSKKSPFPEASQIMQQKYSVESSDSWLNE